MTYILKFFLCGIITSFLFPPFFILPMGFISFPYLFFLITNNKIKHASVLRQFFYGSFFGLGLNSVLLSWIKEPFLINSLTENLFYYSYLLTIYISVYFGLAFILLSFFKNEFCKLIMIPVIFVIMEFIREIFLYGFPWITFALIASANYVFLQIAYYIGTYGLSYVVISLFLFPSIIILLMQNVSVYHLRIYITISIFVFLVLFILVFTRINFAENSFNYNEVNLSLNQVNVNPLDKSNDLTKKERFIEIIETVKKGGNYLFIFSETDYPYVIENDNIVNIFQNLLTKDQLIIIGGIRKDLKDYYNSMYLITKNSFQVFDKKILVPFGEFLPFRNSLNFLEAIAGSSDFSIGKKNRLINLYKNLDFVPVICYEIIFFNDLLEKINNKSPLIINITNDAWFGKHSGPYQHFYLSRIRSVEFNKFLVRVSNNGVSAIIDNYGKILKFLPLNIKEQYNTKLIVPIELRNLVIYHKLIYFFVILVLVFAILVERKIGKFNSKI